MNNFKKIHQKDRNKTLKSSVKQKIKGGIQFFTNNFNDFQKKQNFLTEKGIPFNTHEDDGIYCVEW